MAHLIHLVGVGAVDTDQITAIASFKSKPVKRLLRAADPAKVLYLNYGYPRQTVLLLHNGYLVVTHLSAQELTDRIPGNQSEDFPDDNQPSW
jgi:regulator of extracellular matrix RemA (YlzA/DUF370 family)